MELVGGRYIDISICTILHSIENPLGQSFHFFIQIYMLYIFVDKKVVVLQYQASKFYSFSILIGVKLKERS